jgi:hypothetical protein
MIAPVDPKKNQLLGALLPAVYERWQKSLVACNN